MKRHILALLGFFFVAGATYAETIPATPGGVYTNSVPSTYFAVVSGAGQQTSLTSAASACSNWFGSNYTLNLSALPTIYGRYNIGTCTSGGGTVAQVDVAMVCPATYTIESGTNKCVKTSETCPSGQNWTLSGSTCTRPDCGAGEERDSGGICVCASGAQKGTDGVCCPVSGSGGGAGMQWCYIDGPAATNCETTANNKCKIRCTNVTFQKGTGAQLTIYPKLALGQSCKYTGTVNSTSLGGGPLNNDELNEVSKATADPAKAKTPEGCLASGQGYVTGSTGTTCVSGGDTGVKETEGTKTNNPDGSTDEKSTVSEQGENGTGKETTTDTHTNPDGSTTTKTTTKTCQSDGTCKTETETVNKDASGNTTGQTNANKEQSKASFCDENKDAAVCKGFEDTCKDHPERLGCMEHGEAPEVPNLGETEKGISSIIAVNVASNASCPADIQLPKGMGFSFGPYCDYASAFRPIILVLAWITAGYLLFGYRGNN